MHRWWIGGLVFFLGATEACSCPGKKAPSSTPESLRQTKIPEGFTFTTSGPILVDVRLGPGRQAEGPYRIAILRMDDRVLFEGGFSSRGTFQMKLSVPHKERQLKVRISGPQGTETAEVDIEKGHADHVFR